MTASFSRILFQSWCNSQTLRSKFIFFVIVILLLGLSVKLHQCNKESKAWSMSCAFQMNQILSTESKGANSLIKQSSDGNFAMLHGQIYKLGDAYNFGGNGNFTFPEWLTESGHDMQVQNMSLFHEWLHSRPPLLNKPNHTIFKIICMTMEEWPWIVYWTTYHGSLVGFQNLYIISGDGTRNTFASRKSRRFLQQARDELKANVIFSPSNLNGLTEELTIIGEQLRATSDFTMKVDVDEFLVVAEKNGESMAESYCIDRSHHPKCSLTPFSVQHYLDSELPKLADGMKLEIGYSRLSVPSRTVCGDVEYENMKYFNNSRNPIEGKLIDLGLFPLDRIRSISGYKVVLDSRTFLQHDLGGHNGEAIGLFNIDTPKITALGILHFHGRCFQTEISNLRKACVSHNYINESDSEETSLQKLKKYTGEHPCNVSVDSMLHLGIASIHKILGYAKFLECPEDYNPRFYPETSFLPDQEFHDFLHDAMTQYGGWEHILSKSKIL